jgi:ATP-dependent DNA ligase
VVSKTIDAPYAPGDRGLWRKAKALNRQEFVVVGWSDPEGSRPHLGALLLGYYTDDGKLIYARRVGTGMPVKVLADLRRRLDPVARPKSPLSAPPPRSTRFGSPLVLSRVHWVEPALVAEITYLTWTADNLLRQTVYVGLLRTSRPSRCGASEQTFPPITLANKGPHAWSDVRRRL